MRDILLKLLLALLIGGKLADVDAVNLARICRKQVDLREVQLESLS